MASAAPNREYWNNIQLEGEAHASNLWRRHSDRVNGSLVERWISGAASGRVLKTDLYDEAVGDGLGRYLAALGSVVVGIDVSMPAQVLAQRRHPELITVTADVRKLPFAAGSFNAIISNSTLDHFSSENDIAGALVELARVLRPGGRLVITLDNPANPVLWLRSRLPHSWLFRAGLVPYFVGATLSRSRLAVLLRQANLDVIEETAILHCPRILAIPAAGWFSRRSDTLRRTFSRWLERFETLERFGTRYRTGHFVAALASKPEAAEVVPELIAAGCEASQVERSAR